MLVIPQYFTDVGLVVPYLTMEVAYVGNDLRSLQQIRSLEAIPFGIIPSSLAGLLQEFRQSCLAEISPRYAVLILENGRKLKISYPFKPGTLDWQVFWNDLLANPQVIFARGFGESLSNSFLRRL